uniref:peptidylprolyl isomerase n=2 Tax=Ciona savignyi TaxID=51511 RepID=H2YF81_CIOSA
PDSLPQVDIQVVWKPGDCKREVKSGDFVRYHYYGMLPDGRMFDNSYERNGTYDSYVGSGWLIPGMDEGLMGACLNEHRLITIPPTLAYGVDGTGGLGGSPGGWDRWVGGFPGWMGQVGWGVPRVDGTDGLGGSPGGWDRWVGGCSHSYQRNRTYDTYVGFKRVIPGMELGLLGACMGERRVITLPPHLAYGEPGIGKWGNPRLYSSFEGVIDSRHVGDHMGEIAAAIKRGLKNEEGSTYNTYVGTGWLIKGVDEGLLGACMGERRTIEIPPFLGYGGKGDGKNIPPSASLVFDIEILDFHNPNDEPEVVVTHEAPECKRKLASSDFVRYHYNGSFMDGAVFDSSGSRGNTLGRGELVLGVERGLMGMCVGEVRKVVIPPHIGYGEQGREDPMIPGSAVLLFTFRLHRVEESLPEGYLFMWTNGAPADAGEAFKLIDEDQDHRVSLPELTSYMLDQVERGRARLRPGMPADDVIRKMFRSQDYNDDRHLSIDEFTLKMSDDVRMSHADDEL